MPCLPTLQTLAGKAVPSENGEVPLDIGPNEMAPPYVDAERANSVCDTAALGRLALGGGIGAVLAAAVYLVGLSMTRGEGHQA